MGGREESVCLSLMERDSYRERNVVNNVPFFLPLYLFYLHTDRIRYKKLYNKNMKIFLCSFSTPSRYDLKFLTFHFFKWKSASRSLLLFFF